MYCPKCATSNSEDVKFCRSCGANLSLVSEALTGSLPRPQHGPHQKSGAGGPSLGQGITQISMGVAFLLVSIALLVQGGRGWWWAMLFPAFGLLGKGISEIVSARMNYPTAAPPPIDPNPRSQNGRA